MTQDPWFWIALVAYIGGGINLVIWITDGGSRMTKVPRWKIFAVSTCWPLFTLYGIVSGFADWFLQPHGAALDD